MNCDEARQAWHERIDGELPAEGAASLALHLRACPVCREYAAQMDALAGTLDSLRAATDKIGAAPSKRRRRRIPIIGSLAAAIALLVTAGVFLREHPPAGNGYAGDAAVRDSHPLSTDAVDERPTTVLLSGRSADDYIPVAQPTSQSNVHVFVLYRTTKEGPN